MFARILQHSFERQRRRKSLAALAVIAGMAVATAMLTLRVNLGDDLNHELRQVGANIVLNPAADSLPVTLNGVDLRPAGTGALLRESDLGSLKTIFWTNNIVAFAPLLFTPARIQGEAVRVEGTYFDHALVVPGAGRGMATGMRALATAWQVEGAWPADGGDGILVGEALAQQLHAAPGDALAMEGPAAKVEARVSGIVRSGGAEDDEVIAPLAIAQKLAGAPGGVRQVLVSAITKPEDAFARRDPTAMSAADAERWMCSPYAVTIASQLQAALPGSAATVIRPVADGEGAILAKLELLLLLLTGLALLASALAIAAAMAAAVLERRGEIALMKAMGAQDRVIGSLFLSEAGLLGVGGGAVGYVLGEGLALGIARQVLGHGAAWKPALLPVILLLAASVALVGSWNPLRRALRIDPAVILRGQP